MKKVVLLTAVLAAPALFGIVGCEKKADESGSAASAPAAAPAPTSPAAPTTAAPAPATPAPEGAK